MFHDLEGSRHLEACNGCFIFGPVIGGLKPKSARLLHDGSIGSSKDYPNSGSLSIDVPSTFKIHPFKELFRDGGSRVNLVMKSDSICLLINVLGSKVIPSGLISVTHFAILSYASGFSIMVLSRYSVSVTMGKDWK